MQYDTYVPYTTMGLSKNLTDTKQKFSKQNFFLHILIENITVEDLYW